MSIINSINQPIEKFPELYLLISLNSLKNKRSLYYHACLLEWKPFFDQLNLPVYILTNDDLYTIREIEYTYNHAFLYCTDPTNETFIKKNLLKNKIIYGKCYLTVYNQIELIYNDEAEFISKRINKNSISKAYFKAVDIEYQKFLKKLKKDVDTLEKLC